MKFALALLVAAFVVADARHHFRSRHFDVDDIDEYLDEMRERKRFRETFGDEIRHHQRHRQEDSLEDAFRKPHHDAPKSHQRSEQDLEDLDFGSLDFRNEPEQNSLTPKTTTPEINTTITTKPVTTTTEAPTTTTVSVTTPAPDMLKKILNRLTNQVKKLQYNEKVNRRVLHYFYQQIGSLKKQIRKLKLSQNGEERGLKSLIEMLMGGMQEKNFGFIPRGNVLVNDDDEDDEESDF